MRKIQHKNNLVWIPIYAHVANRFPAMCKDLNSHIKPVPSLQANYNIQQVTVTLFFSMRAFTNYMNRLFFPQAQDFSKLLLLLSYDERAFIIKNKSQLHRSHICWNFVLQIQILFTLTYLFTLYCTNCSNNYIFTIYLSGVSIIMIVCMCGNR